MEFDLTEEKLIQNPTAVSLPMMEEVFTIRNNNNVIVTTLHVF